MERVKSLHVLEVKYSMTGVTIKSWRFDKSKRMGFSYSALERPEQVQQFIEEAGYTILGRDGWKPFVDYIIVNEFEWKW